MRKVSKQEWVMEHGQRSIRVWAERGAVHYRFKHEEGEEGFSAPPGLALKLGQMLIEAAMSELKQEANGGS